jgi:hypothetical protein
MKMGGQKLLLFCIALVGMTLILTVTVQGQTTDVIHEQSSFREDEPLKKTANLPSNVVRALLQTQEAKGALASKPQQKKDSPDKLFRAAEVVLGSPDEIGFVVMGLFPFSGADNTWFWLITYAGKTPRILLWAEGNSLEIMHSRTNGYRNVRTRWSSPLTTTINEYHFDGVRYKLWEKTESNNLSK